MRGLGGYLTRFFLFWTFYFQVMDGWISLHRKIRDNGLYPKNREFTKFEAWIDLLLIVNHTENDCLIGNEIYKCKRGQSVRSIETYQKLWNWTRQQVRSFLKLLQNNSMIELKTTTKTTILTICNYDKYQIQQPTNNQQITNEQPTNNQQITINNNDNNDNNENNDNNKNRKNLKIFEFYQNEIDNNKNSLQIDKYKYLVNYFKEKAPGYLKLNEQLNYADFYKLLSKCEAKNIYLIDMFNIGLNSPKTLKNKKSIYLTVNNWINNNFSKPGNFKKLITPNDAAKYLLQNDKIN